MSIFSISNLAESETKYRISFNQFQNTPLFTGNLSNNVHIRYNKSFYDQNLNQEIYNDEDSGTKNNSIRSIYSTLSTNGIRADKYDFLTGKWAGGYPKSTYYNFCEEKLSTVYSLGNSYISRNEMVGTSYPRNQTSSTITQNNNICLNQEIKIGQIKTKIKTNPSTRGYSIDNRPTGHVLSDDTLYFLYSELGPGNFEITCKAFFTGAPPIVFINEPSVQSEAGQFFIQPIIHKMIVDSDSVVVDDKIMNLQSINDGFTDYTEPMTYYSFDSNVFGYLVEIQILVSSESNCCGGGAEELGYGQFLRWASSISDQETTLQNGIIIAKSIDY